MNKKSSYRYQVVDVFTQTPLEGNPLAVFLHAADLNGSTMQKIARELCLPETVFVVSPRRADCVARFRIFTPGKEMDFAGHPTLGTGFVLVQEGVVSLGTQRFCVEENVGAIPIAVDREQPSMFWLRTPPVQDGPEIDKDAAAAMITLPSSALANSAPQVLSAVNPALFIALKDKSAVDNALLDSSAWIAIKKRYHPDPMFAFVFAPTPEGAYSRMFAPDHGVAEDPATGSTTGPLAVYMMRQGMTSAKAGSRFVNEQGTRMGRKSILHVHVHGEEGRDGIDVGGFVTPVINGEICI
jgi:trans-2,3-dihydro-3-hydroxyanthranilate isomerase